MYDIAVIGAGPAGSSAALLAAKAGKKTIVIDQDKGMTRRAWFENFYGIMEISGPELLDVGHKQVQKFGAKLIQDRVADIQKNGETLTIQTENETYGATHVILSIGAVVDLAQKMGVQTKPG